MKNSLKDKNLTETQKATLKQHLENDKLLIERLDNAKPSACSIS